MAPPRATSAAQNAPALSAVRAVSGLDAETAAEVLEVLRPYLERPLQLAVLDLSTQLRAAQGEIERLTRTAS